MHNLHITAQQTRIFEAVSRHLSYTKAAEELSLSQPAVSAQIKRLEENNDVKLIEVTGKKLFLTSAGEHMFKTCSLILEELKDLTAHIRNQQNKIEGELKLAVVTPQNILFPMYSRPF